MAALGTAREITALPPQNEQRDMSQFRPDRDIGVMYTHQPPPPHHHHLGHRHHYQQIKGHPLITPLSPTSPGFNASGGSSVVISSGPSSGGTSIISKHGDEVAAASLSPDYDNLAPTVSLSCVKEEEGGAGGERAAINRNHDNFATNQQPVAGLAGGSVAGRGEPSGGSGGVSDSGRYKSGDERITGRCSSYSGAGDGSEDVGRLVRREVTCEAVVKRNDMGNYTSSARVGSVSEGRVHENTGVGDKKSSDEVTVNPAKKSAAAIDNINAPSGPRDPKHDDEIANVTPKFPVGDLNMGPKPERSGDSTDHAGSAGPLYPKGSGSHPHSSGKDIQGKGCVSVGETRTVTMVTSTSVSTTTKAENQPNIDIVSISKPEEATRHTSGVDSHARSSGYAVVGEGPEFRQKAGQTKPSGQAKLLVAAQASVTTGTTTTTAPAIIVTPGSPSVRSPLATSSRIQPEQDIGKGNTSQTEYARVSMKDINNSGEGVNAEQDIKSQNTGESAQKVNDVKDEVGAESRRRSAPVGGVKVLPTTFTFNHRSFRETKKAGDVSSPTSPESATMSSSPPSSSFVSKTESPNKCDVKKSTPITTSATNVPRWSAETTSGGIMTTSVPPQAAAMTTNVPPSVTATATPTNLAHQTSTTTAAAAVSVGYQTTATLPSSAVVAVPTSPTITPSVNVAYSTSATTIVLKDVAQPATATQVSQTNVTSQTSPTTSHMSSPTSPTVKMPTSMSSSPPAAKTVEANVTRVPPPTAPKPTVTAFPKWATTTTSSHPETVTITTARENVKVFPSGISKKSPTAENSQDKLSQRPSAEVVVTRPEQTRDDSPKGYSSHSGFSPGIPFSQIRETSSKQKEGKPVEAKPKVSSSYSVVNNTAIHPTSASGVVVSEEVIGPSSTDNNYDSVSLESSGYKIISRPGEARGPDAIVVSSSVNTEIIQHTVVKSVNSAEGEEDIYAVPIPRSQREGSASARHESVTRSEEQMEMTQPAAPPKPPRSPRAATEPPAPPPHYDEDDDAFEDVVMRNKVQVTCQMKKSTTTGMLHSHSSDYSNLPGSSGYDYFSLGRRPRRSRVKTLTDSRGMAVSLDMLLRFRRQSASDVSKAAPVEQTLSVDDILKSCSEYDPNNDPYYRNRTSSDAVRKSPYHPNTPLLFSQVTNVQLETSDNKSKEKREKHPGSTSRPILKKGKQEMKSSGEKTGGDVTAARAKQDTKTNDTLVSPRGVKNFNGNGSDESGAMKQRVAGEKTKVLPVVTSLISPGSGKDSKDRVTFEDSKSANAGRKEPSVSEPALKSETARKSDTVKSESSLDYDEVQEYHVTRVGVTNILSPTSPGTEKASSPVSTEKDKQESSHMKGSSKHGSSVQTQITKTEEATSPKPIGVEVIAESKELKSESAKSTDVKTQKEMSSKVQMATTSAQQPTVSFSERHKLLSVSSSQSAASVAPSPSVTATLATSAQSIATVDTTPSVVTQSHSVVHKSSTSSSPSPTSQGGKSSPASSGKPSPSSQGEQLSSASASGRRPSPETKAQPHVAPKPSSSQTTTSSSTSSASTSTWRSESTSSNAQNQSTSSSDYRESLTSASDVQSPLSPDSVWSDSCDGAAQAEMAFLTVDISNEASLGDSPSPGRRSPNYYAKLEAVEALKWLRAAGFPQYAQMFEDGQFPVELSVVERDHDFLDKDSLKSLFRRLETLNKYAGMKIDAHARKKAASEEEDDDDLCALSERWEYQKSVRRWSRKDLTSPQLSTAPETQEVLGGKSGSHDSLLADQDSGSQTGDSPLLDSKMPHQEGVVQQQGEGGPDGQGQGGSPISPRLRRVASERIKTAKNLFKKVEGLKSKKSRRHPNSRNIVEISGPVVADRENMQAKLQRLNCVDISPTSENLPSPPLTSVDRTDRSPSADKDGQLTSPKSPLSPSSPQPSPYPTSARLMSDPGSGSSGVDKESSSTAATQDSPLRSRFAVTSQSLRARPTPGTSAAEPHRTPSAHDPRLNEYYSAQSTLLQNLQSAQYGGASGAVKKNNSDTNLMEIFLLPQDHQPGRFPRMLQNGYIETEACGTAVNSRTGSVRLGRDTGLPSEHHRFTAGSNQLSQPSRVGGNRISVYDNFSSPDGRGPVEGGTRSVIPGVIELGPPRGRAASSGLDSAPVGSSARGTVDVTTHRDRSMSSDSGQPDRLNASRDSSSGGRTAESVSDQESRDSTRERSVSFESSSSRAAHEGTPASEGEAAGTSGDSQTSRNSSSDSSSLQRRVPHSASVDSYFRNSSGSSGGHSGGGSDNNTSSSTLQQDQYDEFDIILQQLYENINDLSRYIGKDREDGADESMDLDGVTELDNENSWSGGEGSNTAESGSEDQEVILTDLSHDDSLDHIPDVSRERRDSGVGHSLTRAPSERRRKKIRWHSFQRCHRPDISSRAMQINSLTVGQLVRLQKLSLLKLTGIMEKCLPVNKSGWNWMMPRFMKRHKAPDFSEKNVFGVPLSVMAQRTGQPLPQCVLYAMRYLRRTSQNAVGIFRKSGVKSKIQQLRDHLEAHPDTTDFEGVNAYNVADMLKTYFRDLPECLLTNKMSETFRSIYTHVPHAQRLEAIQAAILLLPDENREVLQSILLFLSDISSHEADHQMNASNLAVCFTPTMFQLGTRQLASNSPKRNRKNSPGIPDPREIMEQKAAHECLLMMITECKKLFTVPSNLFRQLQVQSLAHMEPAPLQDIGNSPSEVRAFGQERIQMVLKEAHDKNRGWIQAMTVNDVEVFHRKPMDDCPLKEWKLVVDIEAPPIEVLRRIMHERHAWDEDLLSWSVVERLDPYSDIFQFVLNSMAPHPSRHYCVLRYWRSDLNKGACALITMSVEHSDAMEVQGVWAVDLGTYFLMEPCGSGRSRLTYITRVDTRGRTPEWYTKIFGHVCANFLERLKDSFKQDASGPETKV